MTSQYLKLIRCSSCLQKSQRRKKLKILKLRLELRERKAKRKVRRLKERSSQLFL